MILYLDASALVKRYIAEPGTAEVAEAIDDAEAVGTSITSSREKPISTSAGDDVAEEQLATASRTRIISKTGEYRW